jgi:hypothetical protein
VPAAPLRPSTSISPSSTYITRKKPSGVPGATCERITSSGDSRRRNETRASTSGGSGRSHPNSRPSPKRSMSSARVSQLPVCPTPLSGSKARDVRDSARRPTPRQVDGGHVSQGTSASKAWTSSGRARNSAGSHRIWFSIASAPGGGRPGTAASSLLNPRGRQEPGHERQGGRHPRRCEEQGPARDVEPCPDSWLRREVAAVEPGRQLRFFRGRIRALSRAASTVMRAPVSSNPRY